ncbi:MAG: hypothetical protein ACPGD5_09580 [Salibacteraceae bacterium]
MKIARFHTYYLITMSLLMVASLSSCSKKTELVAFKGTVVNAKNQKVVGASVQIFNSAEDWLTGHNIVANLSTDTYGYFESEKIYESGEYYIFIEKYDTSNWEIRKVEQGIYPKITIPEDEGLTHTIDFNNMSLMASTNWKLTNIHREYTKPGATAVEWQSIWTGVNNCMRDNELIFNKDLSFRFSEGIFICNNNDRNTIGTFIPPIIFSEQSCINLPHTSQSVKEFEYSGWPIMEARDAKMYMACNRSVGQIYIHYTGTDGLEVLEVYSRN